MDQLLTHFSLKNIKNILPWISFSAALFVMVSSGSIFTFSSFSEDFRTKLGYSAKDINFVSGLGNTAVYLAFLIAGVLYDHYGATITMLTSTITYSLGYLLMYLTFIGSISGNVTLMSFYYFLAGYGSSAVYLVATAVNLVNFENETLRGITLGILLLFYGLSATIYAQIYKSLYSSNDRVDTAGFLLFLTLTAFIINAVGTFTVIDVNKLLAKLNKNPQDTKDSSDIKVANLSTQDTKNIPISPSRQSSTIGAAVERISETVRHVSLPVWAMLKNPMFWIYSMVAIWQQGLTYISNVSLIVRSDSALEKAMDSVYIASESSLHVTILSVGQSIGRFAFSYISQYNKPGLLFDAPFLLVIAESILLLPCVLLACITLPSSKILYICSALTGFGFGSAGGLFPALIKGFFGMDNYGTASGLVLLAVPAGILASNQIFGSFYDDEVAKQASNFSPDSELKCIGSSCYRKSFAIFTVIQSVSTFFAVMMFVRKLQIQRRSVKVVDVESEPKKLPDNK